MRQTLPHQAQILPRLGLGLIILLLGQQQKNLSPREPNMARVGTEAWQPQVGKTGVTASCQRTQQDAWTRVFTWVFL